MESAVRQIVSNLGIHTATKKLVCQEYCKFKDVEKLSLLERQEIKQILSRLVEELAVNPEIPFSQAVVSSSPSKSKSDRETEPFSSLQDDHLPFGNVKENQEMGDAEVNKIINEENINDVVKEESPLKVTKKKLFKRIGSKDVIAAILDSGQEDDCASPHNSPMKLKVSNNNNIEIDTLPKRQGLLKKKKKRADVINSILDSDSDSGNALMSPCKTKCESDNETTNCAESPLFKHKRISKKKRLLSSDSESDDGCGSCGSDRLSITSDSSLKQKPASKKRCFQVDSDIDSEPDRDNNPITLDNKRLKSTTACSDSNTEDSELGDAVAKGFVRKVCDTDKDGNESGFKLTDKGQDNCENDSELLQKCKIVLKDCMDKSDQEKHSKITAKSTVRVDRKAVRNRKQSLSSSSDESDHAGSSPKTENTHLTHSTDSKKLLPDNLDSDSDSSCDFALSSLKKPQTQCQTPANEAVKGRKEAKQDSNKVRLKQNEKTELKNLRGICRHIGVILRNTIELQGCDTDDEKIGRIKALLREKGMKGRPSMKSAEQFNLERELRELGAASNGPGSKSPVKGPRRRVRRGEFSSSSSPAVAACNDFSHMKDVFCADDSSD